MIKGKQKRFYYIYDKKEHWVRIFRTQKYLAICIKNKKIKFTSYELGLSFHGLNNNTHLDISDFQVDPENKMKISMWHENYLPGQDFCDSGWRYIYWVDNALSYMVIKGNKYLSSLKISINLEIVSIISCNTKIIIGYIRAYDEITCIRKRWQKYKWQ